MSKLKTSLLTVTIVFSVFAIYVIFMSSGSGIGINVQYVGASGGCNDQKPVLVTITNRMPLPINKYAFQISAKRDGYSTDVRRDLFFKESDKIIPAFGSDRLCWSAPQSDKLAAAYTVINQYGSLAAAAQSAVIEEENKENPSLQWSGKVGYAVWDFGIRYSNY